MNPFSWRVKSGGQFISVTGAADGSGTFKAKRLPGRAELELTTTKVNCRASVTIDVVAPNDVYHIYKQDDPSSGIKDGLITYILIDDVHFRPTDVSFHWLFVGEGASDSRSTGVLNDMFGPVKFPPNGITHAPNGPYAMTTGDIALGSKWIGYDTAGVRDVPVNGVAGYAEYLNIPQQYFDDDSSRIQIVPLPQRAEFDGVRTILVKKGGASHSGPVVP